MARDWAPGDEFLSFYRVIAELGRGGMGAVHRVHHRGWGIDLAVKTPHAEALEAGAFDMFVREAETWVELGLHPHVVNCYYVREVDGLPRVFAELVEGGSLADAIETRRLYDGGHRDALERMLDIAIQFAWGLGYAHEKSLVHQDVKPANVMLTQELGAKVTDFGLAKAARLRPGKGPDPLATYGGMTLVYCSPEQANADRLSFRTDVWSYATSVLHMFAGDTPWGVGVIARDGLDQLVANGPEHPAIPRMPTGVAELLRRCFEDDPQRRPSSMSEIADALCAELPEATRRSVFAARDAARAATLASDSLNNRGVSYFDLGRAQDARKAWLDALERDPTHPEATFNLHMLQWHAGVLADDDVVERLADARTATGEYDRVDQLSRRVLPRHLLPPPGTGATPRCLRVLHGTRVHVVHAALADDLSTAFAFDTDGVLASWDLASGTLLAAYDTELQPIALARDGSVAIGAEYGDDGTEDDPCRTTTIWALDQRGTRRQLFSARLAGELSGALDDSGRFAICIHDRGGETMLDLTRESPIVWQRPSTNWQDRYEGSYRHGAAVAPNGRIAIVRNQVVDIATGKTMRELGAHDVSAVAISPDSRLALLGRDHAIELWEIDSGREVRPLETVHTSTLSDLAFDASGESAVSTAQDGKLCVWNVSTGKRVMRFIDNHGVLTAGAISRCGRFALAGGAERVVRIFDLGRSAPQSWAPELSRPPTIGETRAAATRFDTALDQARAALGRGEARAALTSLDAAFAVPYHARDPAARAFKAELATSCRRGAIRGLYGSLRAHAGNYISQEWRLATDGRYLAMAMSTGVVRVCDLTTGWRRHDPLVEGRDDGDIAELAFATQSGRHRLLVAHEGNLRIFDLEPREIGFRATEQPALSTGTILALSPRFAVGAKSLRETGHLDLFRIDPHGALHGRQTIEVPDQYSYLTIADAAGVLIGKRGERTIDSFDLVSGRPIGSWAAETHPNSLAISMDGTIALVGAWNGRATLVGVKSGRELRLLDHTDLGALRHNVFAAAFSHDGRHVATGGHDRIIAVWEVATGRRLMTFAVHRNEIHALAWTPDSTRIASASSDGTVRVLELDWELIPD